MNLTNPNVLFVEGIKNELSNSRTDNYKPAHSRTNKNNTMTWDEDLQYDPEFQGSCW